MTFRYDPGAVQRSCAVADEFFEDIVDLSGLTFMASDPRITRVLQQGVHEPTCQDVPFPRFNKLDMQNPDSISGGYSSTSSESSRFVSTVERQHVRSFIGTNDEMGQQAAIQILQHISIPSKGVDELDGCTTVMLRHVPSKFSQSELMTRIDFLGFIDKYDFLYLPAKRKGRSHRGFAFVNFVQEEYAKKFRDVVHATRALTHGNSGKAPVVTRADLQGFEASVAHYKWSNKTRGHEPLIFRPVSAPAGRAWQQPDFQSLSV